MIRYIIPVFFTLTMYAQHTSSDFKDAVATGPFPLYFGVGYANSFRNQDFYDVGKEFASYYNAETNPSTRLYGLLLFTGFSYIPENAKVSLGIEVKHLWLTRTMHIDDRWFKLTSQQTSFGLGIRRAFFPIVVQIQGSVILNYKRTYEFDLGADEKSVDFKSPFCGWNTLLRIGILDPAGTEGGLGVYFETGFNWLTKNNNDQLTQAIQLFNDGYSESSDSIGRYGYISFGLLLPIAIRIKG